MRSFVSEKLAPWVERHEITIRSVYRLLTVILLVACLWRIEVAVSAADDASWEASMANTSAEEAASTAREAATEAENAGDQVRIFCSAD